MDMDKTMRVLIIDDQATIRKILRSFLRHLEFSNIVEADNGIRAWEIIQSEKIDFIISDWIMDGITGLDLLRRVRRDEDLKETPFLMVTAEASEAQVIDAIQAQVSDYIVKPFNADMLKTKIEKIFS